MTQGFQQQDQSTNFCFPKSAPSPQHGRQPDPKGAKSNRPSRSFEPKPGH